MVTDYSISFLRFVLHGTTMSMKLDRGILITGQRSFRSPNSQQK